LRLPKYLAWKMGDWIQVYTSATVSSEQRGFRADQVEVDFWRGARAPHVLGPVSLLRWLRQDEFVAGAGLDVFAGAKPGGVDPHASVFPPS
jgi:hypothetical protein